MARLLIGNFKGIKGDKGEKGDDGVIDSNSIISFEDYTNSTPPPTDMALGSIKTGKSISSLLSNIKALLMSTLTTSKLANNLSTNQEGFALDARMGKQLGDSVGAINDTLPSRSKIVDYKTQTSVTNCTCSHFKYLKFGNILFFTASFAATIETPSTYAIRFTLPYAVRDAEASIFSTMASGGGANDVVAYGNINSNSVTVNIHGTHATGYVFYVQGYVFCDD
ncbi:MAG: hypothetical protein H2184_08790 [Candidatus Galacturonibacter soehngenii]|nr:hypothetical protein [Candidatus Galacturonibacter soehngenii]